MSSNINVKNIDKIVTPIEIIYKYQTDERMVNNILNWRNEVFSDDKYTPFLIAVRNGHMHCIRFICEECLNFDLKQMTAKGRDGFLEACLHGRLEVLKYYYKNYKHEIDLKAKDRSGNTALTLSNKSKNKQVKRFIIKLLKQDHKRSKRLLGNATSNSRSKYQRNLLSQCSGVLSRLEIKICMQTKILGFIGLAFESLMKDQIFF